MFLRLNPNMFVQRVVQIYGGVDCQHRNLSEQLLKFCQRGREREKKKRVGGGFGWHRGSGINLD